MKKMTTFSRILMKLRMMLIPDGPYGDRRRGQLYEPYLKQCGKNFKIATQAFIFNPNGLSVGDDVYIGFSSYLGEGEITLKNEVLIGNFVSLTASNHLAKNGSFRFGGNEQKQICIGSGTWLAAHACILAGVQIGSGCLVAAGAIVTKSFGNDLVIAGMPAQEIKKIAHEKSMA